MASGSPSTSPGLRSKNPLKSLTKIMLFWEYKF